MNNHGWSLNTLLICIAVILLALLFSIYYIYKFSRQLGDSLNNSNVTITQKEEDSQKKDPVTENTEYYLNKEQELSLAALRYLKDKNISIEENTYIIININDLVNNGYLKIMLNKNQDYVCQGYAVAKNNNQSYQTEAYINCNDYISTNYGEH